MKSLSLERENSFATKDLSPLKKSSSPDSFSPFKKALLVLDKATEAEKEEMFHFLDEKKSRIYDLLVYHSSKTKEKKSGFIPTFHKRIIIMGLLDHKFSYEENKKFAQKGLKNLFEEDLFDALFQEIVLFEFFKIPQENPFWERVFEILEKDRSELKSE